METLPNQPTPVNIPAPTSNTSPVPDEDTAKGFDWTGDGRAHNRILHISTKWFRYGTDDKGHAAALVLSALLLVSALLVGIIAVVGLYSGKDPQWVNTLITWVGNAFLFTSGIAVGKSAKADNGKSLD
ncbi:hypothetical protein [Bradyrhizobium sp. LB5.2]|uniref:hypothetical protein n=1 Tax=Bradyrhizobium sp. LB5.2 TaxID=3156329 RepID=UPI003391DF45